MLREIRAYAIHARDRGWIRPEQVGNHDVCVTITKNPLAAYLFSFDEDAIRTSAELAGVFKSRWNYDMLFEEEELRVVPVLFSYDDGFTVYEH